MASANANPAALFGDSDSDDDSDDDSVAAPPPAPVPTAEGGSDSDDSNDSAEMKDGDGGADKQEGDSDAGDGGRSNDDKDESGVGKVDGEKKTNSNAALFGDDSDDDSDDDEFDDGGAGIVGRSAPAGQVKQPVRPSYLTDQRDDDEMDDYGDGEGEKKGGEKAEEETEEERRRKIPDRLMKLLDLKHAKNVSLMNDDDGGAKKGRRGGGVTLHTAKLPNLVGINPVAHDPATHDAAAEEAEYRGYVHNMIRWRYGRESETGRMAKHPASGEFLRESNSRMVKWSDGSYTLHIGDEVLEVDDIDGSVPRASAASADTAAVKTDQDRGPPPGQLPGFAGINGYLYLSQKATVAHKKEKRKKKGSDDDSEDEEEEPDFTPGGTVLECLGAITSRLAPKPSSLSSDAHRHLTLAVRQRNVKRARIAEIVTQNDPEMEKQSRMKAKDELEKEKSRSDGRRAGGSRRPRGARMSRRYLEDEDDGNYDGVNLGRLKRRTLRQSDDEGDGEVMDYGEDSEEDEEDEWSRKKKAKRGAAAAKARKRDRRGQEDSDSDSDEGEVVFGDDDDEDEDAAAMFKKRGTGGAKKATVFGDDEDSD